MNKPKIVLLLTLIILCLIGVIAFIILGNREGLNVGGLTAYRAQSAGVYGACGGKECIYAGSCRDGGNCRYKDGVHYEFMASKGYSVHPYNPEGYINRQFKQCVCSGEKCICADNLTEPMSVNTHYHPTSYDTFDPEVCSNNQCYNRRNYMGYSNNSMNAARCSMASGQDGTGCLPCMGYSENFTPGEHDPYNVKNMHGVPIKTLFGTNHGKRTITLHYAPWCGACQNIKPLWEQLIRESTSDDITINMNNEDIHRTNGVTRYPTIIRYTGSKHEVYDGPMDKRSLEKFIYY